MKNKVPRRFQPRYCFKFSLLYVSGDQKERADSWTWQSIRISVDLSHRGGCQRLQTQNWIIIGVPLVTRIPQPIRICMTLFSTQNQLDRTVTDSENYVGTRSLCTLNRLIMFNTDESYPALIFAFKR